MRPRLCGPRWPLCLESGPAPVPRRLSSPSSPARKRFPRQPAPNWICCCTNTFPEQKEIMSILVVGSVAFDSIETPQGRRDRCLGGAATYFALSASYFTDGRVIGVVGEDFTPEHEAALPTRGIDTRGIEHAPGLSFHWTGAYAGNLSEAQTLGTDLNVFEKFEPKIPEA